LNGIDFEVQKPISKEELPACSFQSVDDVYGRPSTRKRVIFENWLNWFKSSGGYCCVASHNSNFFTIRGLVIDNETGKQYHCYITPAHNRCSEII
jgi:hypothetical protein